MTTASLDVPILAKCVQTAALAPSLHNSQPWRFRIDDGTVDVFADRARQLEVLDPSGRELLISVGAAVFTLRLAIGMQSRIPQVSILPDPAQPDLVARIRTRQITTPSVQVRDLAAVIGSRHTNRHPFTNAVVPADVMEQLSAAAAHEGATLTAAGAVPRDVIIGLAHAAEARLRSQGGYRAELGRWTQPRPYRRDGIPPTAYGPWDALEHLPLRDFGLIHPQSQRLTARFEAHPTIAVLATEGDSPAAWINAGQALQRVLLTATHHHLATTPISQPVEIPAVRDLLIDPTTGRTAQMIIRLGYAAPAAATRRRPLADILENGRS